MVVAGLFLRGLDYLDTFFQAFTVSALELARGKFDTHRAKAYIQKNELWFDEPIRSSH